MNCSNANACAAESASAVTVSSMYVDDRTIAAARAAAAELDLTIPAMDGTDQRWRWDFSTLTLPSARAHVAQYSGRDGGGIAMPAVTFTPAGLKLTVESSSGKGVALALAHPHPFSIEATRHALAKSIDENLTFLHKLSFNSAGDGAVNGQMNTLRLYAHAYSHNDLDLRAASLTILSAGFSGTASALDDIAGGAAAPASVN